MSALGDVFKSETLRGSEIVLVDINDKSLKEVESVAKKFIDDNRLDYTITATTDRRTALPADTIVEVPGIVNKNGVTGVNLDAVMPIGFSSLLSNSVGVVRLCAEAAIKGSRELAL